MKILLCTSTFSTVSHGPAKFASLLYSELIKDEKHIIKIITSDPNIEASEHFIKCNPKYIRYFGFLWDFTDSYFYAKKIKEVLTFYNPDVIVFVHSSISFFTALKYHGKIPIIGFINDYEYSSAKLLKIQFNKQWIINIKGKFIEYFSSLLLDRIVVNSNFLANEILNSYHINQEKINLLYKGNDFDNIKSRPFQKIILGNPIKILFVKFDYERGGLYDLIGALNILEDFIFELFIAGPPSNQWEMINSFPKKKHIKLNLLGVASPSAVKQLMWQCDLFCVPAKREALGVANIEALGIGIPVVSTNSGGIPEVLNYGNSGYLAEPNDPMSLSIQICNCIMEEKIREEKINNGLIHVRQNFGKGKMIIEFIKVCENVLSDHHK